MKALLENTPSAALHAYTSAAGDYSIREAVARYNQETFGYVRIAYCAETEKLRRSLPAFQKLAALYKGE